MKVTAGLKCPPEIAPPKKMAANKATAIATGFLPFDKITLKNKNVQINSTKYANIFLYYINIFFLLLIKINN